jgi:hypothetical protein
MIYDTLGELQMGFSKKFVKNASKKIESKSAMADYKIIEPILYKAVKQVASVCPYFSPDDVDVYMQGSYATETNIAFQSKIEIAVEVKKTNDFNPAKMKSKDFLIFDNFYIMFNYDFDVKIFKENLISAVEAEIKHRVKKGDVNFLIKAFGNLQHDIDVCPCFSYKYFDVNGGKIDCKLVYSSHIDENFLMFINLHTANGQLKDRLTNGRYKEMVRLTKTVVSISKREDNYIKFVRGYYIDCLLYNVPTEMFMTADGETLSAFLKVLNWLNFADFSEFTCQNGIWSLWGGADGFWNEDAAKQLVTELIAYYNIFRDDREKIVE